VCAKILNQVKERAKSSPSVSTEVLKKLTTYYVHDFLKYLSLYQYIIQELPSEVAHSIYLEVDTPCSPVPLNCGMAVVNQK
jgi:hypothetical protein